MVAAMTLTDGVDCATSRYKSANAMRAVEARRSKRCRFVAGTSKLGFLLLVTEPLFFPHTEDLLEPLRRLPSFLLVKAEVRDVAAAAVAAEAAAEPKLL